ncbi:hypothetical protein LK994_10870 [Ferruginibacter lapsinanis]|uniref:hypothetical protein n=1 Tax=Ferruginibacter lapsinanis TaxID=563172 RepID=UPI001E46EB47|nr:hypothetical protein [Ferruginibacter lapsinanis]UEG49133.1 hypothetical protein LK994_10870 [Ferruginibacter lapsinanis]
MRINLFVFIFLILGLGSNAFGQDTLPHISVKKTITGKVVISWKNNYGATIKTINIQRSIDSIKAFTTIGTVLNPLNRDNGFVDGKPPAEKMYYRVFIAFDGGSYQFSRSYPALKDTSVYIANLQETNVPQPSGFIPSRYIYTDRENNVIINIPAATIKKYSVKFFDANDKFMFEIKNIPEPYLTLEKVNFKHSGWFNYQLFENEALLEKFQFFISKDYKKGSQSADQGKKNN